MNRLISAINKIEIKPLDIGDRQGLTGYIDFLGPNDLSDEVMYGTDKHGRKFLSLKLTVEFEKVNKNKKRNGESEGESESELEVEGEDEIKSELEINKKVTSQAVVTFFNRYIDSNFVAYGTNWHPPTLFTGNLSTEDEYQVVITRLNALQNGHIIRDIEYTKCFYTDDEMREFYAENKYGNGTIDIFLPSARLKFKNNVKKLFYHSIHTNLLSIIAEFI